MFAVRNFMKIGRAFDHPQAFRPLSTEGTGSKAVAVFRAVPKALTFSGSGPKTVVDSNGGFHTTVESCLRSRSNARYLLSKALEEVNATVSKAVKIEKLTGKLELFIAPAPSEAEKRTAERIIGELRTKFEEQKTLICDRHLLLTRLWQVISDGTDLLHVIERSKRIESIRLPAPSEK